MLILIGPSASGKTEVAKLLMKNHHLEKLITCTTREKRLNEVDGKDYYFLSKEDFITHIEQNDFAEYVIYNNNYYGTLKKEIKDNKCVILEPEGAKNILKIDPKAFIVAFIDRDEIRKNRMIARGDNLLDIEKRISLDKEKFSIRELSFANVFIGSSNFTLEEMTSIIFKDYQDFLK